MIVCCVDTLLKILNEIKDDGFNYVEVAEFIPNEDEKDVFVHELNILALDCGGLVGIDYGGCEEVSGDEIMEYANQNQPLPEWRKQYNIQGEVS